MHDGDIKFDVYFDTPGFVLCIISDAQNLAMLSMNAESPLALAVQEGFLSDLKYEYVNASLDQP